MGIWRHSQGSTAAMSRTEISVALPSTSVFPRHLLQPNHDLDRTRVLNLLLPLLTHTVVLRAPRHILPSPQRRRRRARCQRRSRLKRHIRRLGDVHRRGRGFETAGVLTQVAWVFACEWRGGVQVVTLQHMLKRLFLDVGEREAYLACGCRAAASGGRPADEGVEFFEVAALGEESQFCVYTPLFCFFPSPSSPFYSFRARSVAPQIKQASRPPPFFSQTYLQRIRSPTWILHRRQTRTVTRGAEDGNRLPVTEMMSRRPRAQIPGHRQRGQQGRQRSRDIQGRGERHRDCRICGDRRGQWNRDHGGGGILRVGVGHGGHEAGEEQRYSGAHDGRRDGRLMGGLQECVVARGRGTVWYRSTATRDGTTAVPSVFDDGRWVDCVRNSCRWPSHTRPHITYLPHCFRRCTRELSGTDSALAPWAARNR
jgi:hypothetical protein